MNVHIRSDTNDRLRLRRSMRQHDKDLVKDAGRKQIVRQSVNAFRIKINREYVYKSHKVELVIPPGGTEEDARVNVVQTVSREEGDRINEQVVNRMHAIRFDDDTTGQEGQLGRPPRNRAERRQLEREMKKAAKKRW